MLRLKCLLLESSKSNFAKEIHYGTWNPHEPFFVTSSRAPLSQFVIYGDVQSEPIIQRCLSLKFYMQINVYNPLSPHQNTTKKPYSPTEAFVIVFFNTETCMHNEVMAVWKFILLFFRLIALRTSYVMCVSYLFRHMFLKRVMLLSG